MSNVDYAPFLDIIKYYDTQFTTASTTENILTNLRDFSVSYTEKDGVKKYTFAYDYALDSVDSTVSVDDTTTTIIDHTKPKTSSTKKSTSSSSSKKKTKKSSKAKTKKAKSKKSSKKSSSKKGGTNKTSSSSSSVKSSNKKIGVRQAATQYRINVSKSLNRVKYNQIYSSNLKKRHNEKNVNKLTKTIRKIGLGW